MADSSDSRPAEAVLAEIARWGPYFAVEVRGADALDDDGWEPIATILEPAALRRRIEAMGPLLPGVSPATPAQVQARVAASITHLGLLARLLSPRIGAASLGLLLSTRLDDDRCILAPGSSFALRLPRPDGSSDVPTGGAWAHLPTPARTRWAHDLLTGVADPVRAAIEAVVPLPGPVARSNLASAIHGTLAAAAWTRRGRTDPRHDACVSDLLATPQLASTWRGGIGDASFRRAGCCLLYRVRGRVDRTQVCGDCVLRPARPALRTERT